MGDEDHIDHVWTIEAVVGLLDLEAGGHKCERV
jgi:hypothetical protein